MVYPRPCLWCGLPKLIQIFVVIVARCPRTSHEMARNIITRRAGHFALTHTETPPGLLGVLRQCDASPPLLGAHMGWCVRSAGICLRRCGLCHACRRPRDSATCRRVSMTVYSVHRCAHHGPVLCPEIVSRSPRPQINIEYTAIAVVLTEYGCQTQVSSKHPLRFSDRLTTRRSM